MKYSVYCSSEKNSESGFTLLEMILVISISSLLAIIFLQLIVRLYQDNEFFNLQSAWQLDAYLAVDFMALQLKNARNSALGRAVGSTDIAVKDFGKNMALLNKIEELRFEIVEPGLLKISLCLMKDQKSLTVSRLISI